VSPYFSIRRAPAAAASHDHVGRAHVGKGDGSGAGMLGNLNERIRTDQEHWLVQRGRRAQIIPCADVRGPRRSTF
jgi:hypothetical protein